MSAWDSNASEPDRHARASSLQPDELQDYLHALADPSWRVRKAALGMVPRFARHSGFLGGLVQSLASEDNAGLRNAASEALIRVGEPAVFELARAVGDADPDVRKMVVETLGNIGGSEAETALKFAVYDDDVNVRTAAVEALGKIGSESAAEELLQALERYEEDPQSAAYILDALSITGVSVPLARLKTYWARPVLQRSLYAVLARTGDLEATALLLEGVTSASRGNRSAATVALADLGTVAQCLPEIAKAIRVSRRAQEALLGVLDDEDDHVVSAAVLLLGAIEDPSLAPAILDACSTRTNIELAVRTVRAMGRAAVSPLLSEIYRVGIESRVLFLEAIELIGSIEHVEDLLDIALHSEPRTAEAAVRAVGRIGDPGSVDGLINLAKRTAGSELPAVVAHAVAEIGRRSPEHVASKLRGLVEEPEVPWLIALGALGRDEDIELLHAAVSNPRGEVRRAAFDAASIFGQRFPEETLILGLTDEVAEVRVAAARGLGSFHSQDAVDALLAVVNDPDPWVAAEAVRSLGTVGGPKVLATLRAAVSSRDSMIVLAALAALFRLNPPDLRGMLDPALQHADAEVVREVVSVSIRLDDSEAMEILIHLLEHRFWTVRRASAEALISRQLRAPESLLSRRLGDEDHPLVLASLHRLAEEVHS